MTGGARPESWIVHFDDERLPEGDLRDAIGGKGAGLVEMVRAGFSVPLGFTIRVEACEHFVVSGSRWPDGLREAVREAMGRVEARSGRRFGGVGESRLLVSVRSGAAVSMPGMMDTVLDCGREDDPWEELFGAIERVFRSFSSERARSYRRRHRLVGIRGTAVTIQEMFPSEVSGVLFSVDPSGESSERAVIESAFGLGEAIVSGSVTPDRFLVDRQGGQIVSFVPGRFDEARHDDDEPKASLDDEQVRSLLDVALRLERERGHPVDIEWAFATGRLALLQVREIRGLEVARAVEQARRSEIDRLRALSSSAGGSVRRGMVWVRHNLSETLERPTPLTWSFVRLLMSGNGGFGRLYRRLGYRPSRRVLEDGFLELICGRIFADPDRLAELFWDGLPLKYDLHELRRDPRAIDRAPRKFRPELADGRFLLELPRNVWALLSASRRMRRRAATIERDFAERIAPAFVEFVESARAVALDRLDDVGLLEEIERRVQRVLVDFAADSLEPGYFGALAFERLERRLVSILGRERGSSLAIDLIGGLDGDSTVEQDSLLWEVARDRARMDVFVERYGHRCPGEMELREPRWRDAVDELRPLLDFLRRQPDSRAPSTLHSTRAERRREAERSVSRVLAEGGASSLEDLVQHDLELAQRLLPFRETGKHYWTMGYALLRDVVEECARRTDLGDAVYFLEIEELRALVQNPSRSVERARLVERVEERRRRWEAFGRLVVADVVDCEELEDLGRPAVDISAEDFQGTPVSPGYATGGVRIVDDPRAAGDLGDDYVLVCPSTDPGWTPLFVGARALVVERGGVLSHGAIVARDFGIPAVVLADATRQLREGDRVEVDGSSGRVAVVSGSADSSGESDG